VRALLASLFLLLVAGDPNVGTACGSEAGTEICLSATSWITCGSNGVYSHAQFCQPGSACVPIGEYIYCIPTDFQPFCPVGKLGPYTMDQAVGGHHNPVQLPFTDPQFATIAAPNLKPKYSCEGPGSDNHCYYDQTTDLGSPSNGVVEGDTKNNLLIDFSATGCRPGELRFGLAFNVPSSTVINTPPRLRVYDMWTNVVYDAFVPVTGNASQVNYLGPSGAKFEITLQNLFGSSVTEWAFDNLEFCCGCSPGTMACTSGNTYTMCAGYTGSSQWGPTQPCGSGTTCSTFGNYIYCV